MAPGPSPSKAAQLITRFGGVAGLVYSTLPIVAFTAADTFLALPTAIGIALAAATAVLGWRLWHRHSYQPAVAGFLGVAVGAALSLLTGQSKDYFVIHIWAALAMAALFTASIIVRRPAVGHLWAWQLGPVASHPRAMLAFDVATSLWIVVFLSRFLVQHHFYDTDQTTWLGITRIAMGWPLTALAAGVTVIAVRAARRALDRT